ncbi:uncharacterized protein LOC134705967 [Mytilus trossulus]|uniref:uncharacterized protein LOC134705967 n=1 Tax=Mytilus trossulus TaxID=6551 RepID=UPI00300471CE
MKLEKNKFVTMLGLSLCVLFLSAVAAYEMKFDYHISEGKARFLEKIETNLEKNVVKIHVPAHNDILESYRMQDFQKGKQITCLPSLRECRLRDIDRQIAVDAGQMTEAFIRSWNNGVNSITSSNSTVIEELYYLSGEIIDTVTLGESLKQFFEGFGFPLYQETKIPQGAEVLKIVKSSGTRVKRSLGTLSSDCKGQAPKRKYGVDSGASCNYLKICSKVGIVNGAQVFTDCNNIHIHSPLAYVCVCCPWVTQIDLKGHDCACTKMDGSR